MTPRDIERATITAWPAAITERHNGWFYLASGGVTGRVNAVWPLEWTGGAALDAAIAHAEGWYAARGLPPRFKLTDNACAPAELGEALGQRGYAPVAATYVMTRPLPPLPAEPAVALSATMPSAFDDVLRRTAKDAAEYDERRAIALRAPPPACFGCVERNGAVLAIGMTAGTAELAGLFLMRTAPEARRQGMARRIVRALLADAAARGARHAFLQVEADNAPAIALYESEGFSVLTTYRFWRKP
ncbi:MAG: GNAT family N-acetyltransferase [Hyphomonadaceae bacterium]|nr:GNAT family N-acetyltransferase [Hyphomonadaceae bacterium]